MTNYSINPEQDIVNIANAIREKNGSSSKYTVKQMPQAIRDIQTQSSSGGDSGDSGGGSGSGGDTPMPAITVDSELSSSSENPVQNKVINAAIEALNTALNGKTDIVFVSSTDSYTAGTTALATGRVAIVYDAS